MRDSTLFRLFIFPTVILLIALNVFPLFWSLFLSFTKYTVIKPTNWGRNPRMVGTANYAKMFSDRKMWSKFTTTAKYVVLTVSGQMILGFGLALLLQMKFKGRGLVTTLLILPMTMSPVIIGLMWRLFYDPNYGMFDYLLGLGRMDWISDPRVNFYSIVIVDIWMWTPFVMLLSIAGLSAVPRYLYEAAEVDRASWWFKFSRITLPMVSPLLMIALIFRTMEAFKIFDLPMGITGRGAVAPPLLAMHLFKVSFETWGTSTGSAIGFIMLVTVIAITAIFIKYLNKVKQ
jgi:multiple sugar transport system permease protein